MIHTTDIVNGCGLSNEAHYEFLNLSKNFLVKGHKLAKISDIPVDYTLLNPAG